ncbi:MAG: glycosyltransferase [bacterium]
MTGSGQLSVALPAVLRTALAEALGLSAAAVDGLQMLVHFSHTGWSHHVPAARFFLFRDGAPVATVKRIPRYRAVSRAHIFAAYDHLAGATRFLVPRQLAAVEDQHAIYVVETMIVAPNLAGALARGAIDPATAAAALDAVLHGIWDLRRPLDDATLQQNRAALHAAAEAVLGDQPARVMVEAALHRLVEQHRDEFATVFTTHDVHTGNVLRQSNGQLWLTDFDLAGSTAFFGLDYYRAWFLSAPLHQPAAPPAWISPAAMRLYEVLYPLFEYHLQSPHLATADREHLRRYAEDLLVRLTLPAYHRGATFQPLALADDPPQLQLFFADAADGFDEAHSLRFPFDVASGRLAAHAEQPNPLPRWLRIDPCDRAHTALVLHGLRITRGGRSIDVAAALADTAPGVSPVALRPLPGTPGGFWTADGDPQIVVDLDALASRGAEAASADGVELDVELVREWRRRAAFDPAALRAHLNGRALTFDAALAQIDGERAAQLAASRSEARQLRELAARPASASAGAPPLLARRLPASFDEAAALAVGLARGLAARAAAWLRPAPPAAPMLAAPAALVYSVAAAGRWPDPLVAVVLRLDDVGAPDEAAVQAWLAAQTCQSVECIAWSAHRGLAWAVDAPRANWPAPDWAALCATLAARYIALASPALLATPPVHLEINVLALESERLDAALTVQGDPTPAYAALAAGEAAAATLLVRVDCAAEPTQLDAAASLARRNGHAAAAVKVIVHPSAAPPTTEALTTSLSGWRVAPPYLVTAPPQAPVDAPLAHPLRLVDAAVSLAPVPSALPTILTVFPFLAVGGAERVALDVMRQLADRVRWVVVGLEAADPRLGTTADLFRAITPYVYTAPDFLVPLLNYSLLAHLIGRFAPQTLYIANGCGWIYDALPTLKAQFPALRTVNQVYDQRHGWIDRYDATLIAALDAHIGCNDHICAAYRARGAAGERVHEVPHGIDTADFDPARFDAAAHAGLRARFGLAPDTRVVAFLSRLHPQKRPMDFVELARQSLGDPTLQFLMVGDGPLRGDIEAAIRDSRLTNMVTHPFHHPSRDLFAVADVVVLPSAYEGMPLVVLEAQAMGVPVVTTDVGNTRDLLAHGGGVVVDAVGDVGALRRALRSVLDAPPDAAAMRAAVAERWGVATVSEQYRRVLLE